ncbi:hypothetical protein ANO11243_028320 [Dothideomycetidae sp. 11243]|nr:hypothetical protein ANO11243_028320 [fungal sp. No.11243]
MPTCRSLSRHWQQSGSDMSQPEHEPLSTTVGQRPSAGSITTHTTQLAGVDGEPFPPLCLPSSMLACINPCHLPTKELAVCAEWQSPSDGHNMAEGFGGVVPPQSDPATVFVGFAVAVAPAVVPVLCWPVNSMYADPVSAPHPSPRPLSIRSEHMRLVTCATSSVPHIFLARRKEWGPISPSFLPILTGSLIAQTSRARRDTVLKLLQQGTTRHTKPCRVVFAVATACLLYLSAIVRGRERLPRIPALIIVKLAGTCQLSLARLASGRGSNTASCCFSHLVRHIMRCCGGRARLRPLTGRCMILQTCRHCCLSLFPWRN